MIPKKRSDRRNAIAHEMQILAQYVEDEWDTDDDLSDVMAEILQKYEEYKNSSVYCETHRC